MCSEFEQAIFDLKDRFIKFPLTSEENLEKIEEFEELYRIPQIVGAIDGCHIEKMLHHRITKIILIESSTTV